MAVERNSKGVYLMLRNKITNNRLSLLLDEGTKKLVLDSEISGEWTDAEPIITKSDIYEDLLDDNVLSKFTQFVTEILNDVEKENKNHIYHFVYPASRRYRKITVFLDYSFR